MAGKTLNRMGQIVELMRSSNGDIIGPFDTEITKRRFAFVRLGGLARAICRHLVRLGDL